MKSRKMKQLGKRKKKQGIQEEEGQRGEKRLRRKQKEEKTKGWDALERVAEEVGGEGVAGAERKVVRKREEPEVKSRDRSGKRWGKEGRTRAAKSLPPDVKNQWAKDWYSADNPNKRAWWSAREETAPKEEEEEERGREEEAGNPLRGGAGAERKVEAEAYDWRGGGGRGDEE